MTLFDQITDWNNLYAAYKGAAAGKHDRVEVLRHDLHCEKILWQLKRQLEDDSYRHGKYRTFQVNDPKPRDVAAAPFTDRIVHHALVRVIEPLFERIFIYDSYACRKGKGTHAAVLRLQHFLRSAHDKYGEFYVLRGDIRKFFASIDHLAMLKLLGRQIYCQKTLALCQKIIDSYSDLSLVDKRVSASNAAGNEQPQLSLRLAPSELAVPTGLDSSLSLGGFVPDRATGLPIGNLTSQLFANAYLNHLDQFIKHQLKCHYYIRYMDDFLLIHPSKEYLWQARAEIESFLADELKLSLHPDKTVVKKFAGSERFVGYDAGLFTRRLSEPTVQRFQRRMKRVNTSKDETAVRAGWENFRAYASFAHANGLLSAIDPYHQEAKGKDI